MHPVGTKGKWVQFQTLPGFKNFVEAVKVDQQRQRQEEQARREAERTQQEAEAAERRRKAAIERANQEAANQAERQRRSAYAVKQREQDGSDRWPHLVRYANFVDVWGIVVQVLATVGLCIPSAGLATAGGWGMFSRDEIGVLLGLSMILVAFLWAAVAIAVGYWLRLVLGAMADFLKCHAAIESNTRRLWSALPREEESELIT
jgi:hypothetical protein